MPVLGITGGIATGKSTFTRLLLRHLPAEFFDADACAKDLLESDGGVQNQVREAFGDEVFDEAGCPNRALLRARVFADPHKRSELENILHPNIRRLWTARAEAASNEGQWFFADIPLLYETGAESYFDRVIVVACTAATQQERLRTARGLSAGMAAQIIAAQLDLGLKILKGDHLIWNDARPEGLDAQAGLLSSWLRQRYG